MTRLEMINFLKNNNIMIHDINLNETEPAHDNNDWVFYLSTDELVNLVKAVEKEKAGKKLTKKEIYLKYSVHFDPSKNDKVYSIIGWIPQLLKDGNGKTGKLVLTYSLLPGTALFEIDIDGNIIVIKGTCCCDCDGCYAKAGRYNTETVIGSMGVNTYLTNNHIEFVYRCIMAQLEIMERGEIRIHAAGDFNTKDPDAYANMWHKIAEKNNTFRFWTYTKVKRFETLFDDLKNANIVKSVIPGIGFNFGHCDYIINAYYTLKEMGKKVYICKCGIDKNQHCQNCGVCATYEYVLFIEHSTEYKAELDPLYPKLCEIANNQ